MDKITANNKELMDDGAGAAIFHFHKAIETIDSTFGKGYAKEHPELIGAFMKAATIDSGAAYIAKAIQEHAEETKEALTGMNSTLWNIREELNNLR